MNYNTRLKVSKMKNNIIKPTNNIPTDNYLEILEEMNKTLWSKDDFEMAAIKNNEENIINNVTE